MVHLTISVFLLVATVLMDGPTAVSASSPTPSAHSEAVLIEAAQRHADPELEALLPTTLGGVALTIESQSGTDLTTRSAPFDAFLASLGKTRSDFSLASAYASGGLRAEVGAWRVRGAETSLLLPGFKTAVQASSATPLNQAEESLAGKAVTRIGDPGQLAQGPLYIIVRGDTLLFVQTTERSLAEEAIGKLPE